MTYTRQNPSPELNDHGGQYDYSVGSKFKRGQDITEIAKLVRADIKNAIKAGHIPAVKVSVTISRYSMGQSLSVCVVDSPLNLINPARVAFEAANPNRWHSMDDCPREQYAPEGDRILAVLRGIVSQYNYDRSDSMTDYYDVNFSGNVQIAWTLSKMWAELTAAEQGAGNAPTLAPVEVEPVAGLAPVIAGPAKIVQFPTVLDDRSFDLSGMVTYAGY